MGISHKGSRGQGPAMNSSFTVSRRKYRRYQIDDKSLGTIPEESGSDDSDKIPPRWSAWEQSSSRHSTYTTHGRSARKQGAGEEMQRQYGHIVKNSCAKLYNSEDRKQAGRGHIAFLVVRYIGYNGTIVREICTIC